MADSGGNKPKIFVPQDRIFERTQGCWNCVHKSDPKEWWNEQRQKDLKRALDVSLASKLGENHPKCMNIKAMVDKIDHLIAAKALVRCGSGLVRPGRTADGKPVGDLIAPNYLCNRWSGAQGASIARAGQAPDPLPEELADKIGNALPDPEHVAKQVKDYEAATGLVAVANDEESN
jgi:hypothetical protein